MAKRFINPEWKSLRKLPINLQVAFFYCWDKADACGVYEYDEAYIVADLGCNISLDELKKMPGVKILPGERIFFTEFIEINYGTLKEGYNPHKPAFRALEKNKISSLNEACTKLEEEDKDKEEDKDVILGKSENPLKPKQSKKENSPGAKNWNTKPGFEEIALPLPEIKAGSIIELMRITKNVDVDIGQVQGLWSVFKAQWFNGVKFYKDENDVYSHFINWCQSKEIKKNGTHNQPPGKDYSKFGKSAGAIRAGHELAKELGIDI